MSHLRITGGQARGQKISVPNVPGVRPSPDRARTTLFNWLMALSPAEKTLDLFSGSGILAFESLSRGAKEAHLVDRNSKVIQHLKKSCDRWTYGKTFVHKHDCIKWLEQNQPLAPFDLIFIDPPFDQPDLLDQCLEAIADTGFLSEQGALYYEQSIHHKSEPPMYFETYREKKIGHVRSTLLHRNLP